MKAFIPVAATLAVVGLVGLAGCVAHQTEVPALSGPSGLALSLNVSAIPDSISQDGGSQSSIRVTAVGADGRGVSGLPLRMDMRVNGVPQDYGSFSARSIVTNADGVASSVYTAPPSPAGGLFGTCGSLPGTCVDIVATTTGGSAEAATSQSVRIRLVPPGVILPPAGTPTAAFTTSPTPVLANVPVTLDASSSTIGAGASSITSYSWSFGDNSAAGTGRTITHTFTTQQTFNITLTVINDRGLSASTTVALAVGALALPSPKFVFSPGSPVVGQTVVFNADQSTAASGHILTTFNWNFGDGATKSGFLVSHDFGAAGTYNVVLAVLDDTGQKGTIAQTVTVTAGGGGSGPTTAKFTFSPSAPGTNQSVFFNASTSSASTGHSLTTYAWDFGDGSSGSGVSVTHAYAAAGTFTVTLIVTDDIGQKGTTTSPVTVSGGAGASAPTAKFISSPTAPVVNQTVFFNASSSTPAAGHTLTTYAWDFGDGSNGTGLTPTHAYARTGTFNVTLVVTDDAGQTGTVSAGVNVAAASGGGGATIAAFTFSPVTPSALQPVFFNASTSSAATGRTLTTYAWNFGDGTLISGATVSATHTFAAAGTFSVTLIVTDDIGQTGTVATPVTVAAAGSGSLTADFSISPTDPRSGQLVTFNANLSSPVAPITSYDWDFGDGTVVNGQAGFLISHTYFTVTGNTFTIRLTVHDNTGRVATTTKTLPVLPGSDPTASFTVSPSPATVSPTIVTFDGSTSTAVAPKTIARYTWDFGDGSAIFSPVPPTTTTATHSYAAKGTYVIRLTVTDSAGLSSSTTRTLLVQ